MSWKFVFYNENKRWGTIFNCMSVAHEAGYKFFTWNGNVYFINKPSTGDCEAHETGITIDDLK